MLRPPHSRDVRRSPSPVVDESMWGTPLRSDPKHRPQGGISQFGDASRAGKPNSPTQYFVPGQREESLHPFATASRNEDQRRALASHSQNASRNANAANIPPKALEVLRRSIVKFVNTEDNTTRTVNVSGCTSGVEVLEMVLRKFSKTVSNAVPDIEPENDILEVDGWRVSITGANGKDGKPPRPTSLTSEIPLSETALLDFCHGHPSVQANSQYDPVAVREKRLSLRKVTHPLNRKNMEIFFGEVPPAPLSPHSPSYGAPGVPRFGVQSDEQPEPWQRESNTAGAKKLNRASTMSIMSGLGAPVPGVEATPSPNSARSSMNSNLASRTKKMYNFFGHRPPSELISNHLSEYFPSARKKDLEKTVRQSMLRLSQGHSDRHASIGQVPPVPQVPDQWASPQSAAEGKASPKRAVRPPSTRTVSSSTTPAAIPEEGEAANQEPSVSSPSAVDNHPPLLPPFESTGESLVDSLQQFSPAPSTLRASVRSGRRGSAGSTVSRISVISSIRKNKDKSDSASLLTVDEITAEVENRRASMSTFNASVDSVVTPAFESEDALSEDDEDEESDEALDSDNESEVMSDDEGKDQGRAYTSTGCRLNVVLR